MIFLVTGAAGFIGSRLCERLMQRGHQVVGVDNFSQSSRPPISNFFQKSDVVNFTNPTDRLDGVFHCADIVGVETVDRNPEKCLNSRNADSVVRIAETYDCPVVFTSTSDLYDSCRAKENRDEIIDLSKRTSRNYYRLNKLRSEWVLAEASVPTASVRLFNVIGPRQRPEAGVVAKFFDLAREDKKLNVHYIDEEITPFRSFTDVRDVVKGLNKIMDELRFTREDVGPINLGKPGHISIRAMAKLITSITGCDYRMVPRPRSDDPLHKCPDVSKLRCCIDIVFRDTRSTLRWIWRKLNV